MVSRLGLCSTPEMSLAKHTSRGWRVAIFLISMYHATGSMQLRTVYLKYLVVLQGRTSRPHPDHRSWKYNLADESVVIDSVQYFVP